MMTILVFFILILPRIHGKFLLNSESSSIIVLRHIRLTTDNEYYRIRCPYHLNHLTLTLLNYSSENCFDLYTKSLNNACQNYRSPCRFHAKSLQLNCNDRPYSNHVDITYQCSFSPSITTNKTSGNDENYVNSSIIEDESNLSSSNSITLHSLSFPSTLSGIEETIGIFLIGLITVFILWLTVCCLWVIRCGHKNKVEDGKCELLSFRTYEKDDIIDFHILSQTKPMIVGNLSGHTNTGGLENVCLQINPLENKCLSSLKITQID
jgi:hypothetical protein